MEKILCKMLLKSCMASLQGGTQAKLLGAAYSAIKTRALGDSKKRLKDFKQHSLKVQKLREAGACAAEYVRVAGNSAVLCGADIKGVSDTHLKDARNTMANCIAPPTAGKNPDMVHFACMPIQKTSDPAYSVHAQPIQKSAMARWEGWAKPRVMKDTCQHVSTKLDMSKGSAWSRNNVPTATVIATAKRLQ